MGGFMSTKRSRSRKAHWNSGTKERRKIMSAKLSKEMRAKYGIKTMPICRGDEIIMMNGTHVDKEARVTSVYRKRFIIQTDKITLKNSHGKDVPISIQPSNVMITNLHMTNSRMKCIERKAQGAQARRAQQEKRNADAAAALNLN